MSDTSAKKPRKLTVLELSPRSRATLKRLARVNACTMTHVIERALFAAENNITFSTSSNQNL